MMCPKWLPKAIMPAYRIRGRIVSRSYERPSSRLETSIRRTCERIIDWVEMWEARPAFEAMNRQLEEIHRVQTDLEILAAQFGIELPKDRTTQATAKENR